MKATGVLSQDTRNDLTQMKVLMMNEWTRRDFMKTPLLGAVSWPLSQSAGEQEFAGLPKGAIDVNVMLFRWPFRRMNWDSSEQLAEGIQEFGVIQAWAGSFEALLQRDMAGVNLRLTEECRKYGDLFVPFGTVNPMLPDWEEDLRRCREEHGMPGIRLFPEYHGYQLDDPSFRRLLELAGDRDLLVQIAILMEDPRTRHPKVNLAPVEIDPLGPILDSNPELVVVLLNAFRNLTPEQLNRLSNQDNLYFEISWLEGLAAVERLIEIIPPEHLLFGSYSPAFYFEASWLKMKESVLESSVVEAIVKENARRIL